MISLSDCYHVLTRLAQFLMYLQGTPESAHDSSTKVEKDRQMPRTLHFNSSMDSSVSSHMSSHKSETRSKHSDGAVGQLQAWAKSQNIPQPSEITQVMFFWIF